MIHPGRVRSRTIATLRFVQATLPHPGKWMHNHPHGDHT